MKPSNEGQPEYFFLFRLVQWAAVALFLGRAIEHLFWDAPFRALLWDEAWMSGIVEQILGMRWEDYITNEQVDLRIEQVIRIHGWFYLCCAFLALAIRRLPIWLSKVLYLGSASLVFLSFLFFKEKFYSIGQFLEYTLQFSTPVFLVWLYRDQHLSNRLLLAMKIAIAITFTCHGLYAVGYYPQPGHFVEMVINILRVEEGTAIFLLKGMGILDFVLSVLIFLPFRWAQPALLYAVFWGFATCLARVWSNWQWDFLWESIQQNAHESILRFPHFLIPLAVYWAMRQQNKKRNTTE